MSDSQREFLVPKYTNQKSFGYRAEVITIAGVQRLYSYGTHVATVENGQATIHSLDSSTTSKHVREFLQQNGFTRKATDRLMDEHAKTVTT